MKVDMSLDKTTETTQKYVVNFFCHLDRNDNQWLSSPVWEVAPYNISLA